MDRVLKIINILLLSIVGMLLLTGVMVLFQGSKLDLGKAADWWAALSAIGTLGTFYVAWIVYRKVPDWLAPKLTDRKFKFADEIIDEFCALQQQALCLYIDMWIFLELDKNDSDTFTTNSKSVVDKSKQHMTNTLMLKEKIKMMSLWDLCPHDMDEFKNLLKYHTEMFDNLHSAHSFKLSKNNPTPDEVSNFQLLLKDSYLKIIKSHSIFKRPYNELFAK
ncbi:hypothetical protein [Leclercia tamurae]|uniref:hypothetical protein n=1 Tax=Leclercia tamurae TaxID=2926467 RepID=UPI0036F4958A